MKKDIKVSIIVPVYNVQNYLNKCINSLINQTFKEIEIIAVNDGSTDTSGHILDSLSLKYNFIKVIHQKNLGLSEARNTGINLAQGKYIAFVDSDDYIEHSMIKKLYEAIESNNVDIVSCRYAKVTKEGLHIFHSSEIFELIDSSTYLYNCLGMEHSLVVWNKLYKKEIFDDKSCLFPKGLFHEDILVSCLLAMKFYKVKNLNEVLYFWVQRDSSISQKVENKHICDRIKILEVIKKSLINYKLYPLYKEIFMIGCLRTLIFFLNSSYNRDYTNSLFIKLEKMIDFKMIKNKYLNLYQKFIIIKNSQGDHMNNTAENDFLEKSEINYDFTKKLNYLFSNIDYIKAQGLKIAIYGNGLIGNMIAPLLKDQLIVITDHDQTKCSLYAPTCLPTELNKYSFDIIIISVLGREYEIKQNLIKLYNISNDKIVYLDLTQNFQLLMPISTEEEKRLSNFKNQYKNKRCFIIGNGPSLNKCDLNLLKNEYTFGVNGLFYKTDEMGFKPTFYMVEDNHVIDDNLKRINEYNCRYKFFPSVYANKITKDENVFFFTADFGFYDENNSSFCKARFSYDFSKKAFAGQTVTYLQIQLAFYLGFSEIYLIGMDYNYDVPKSTIIKGVTYESQEDDLNHFHPEYFGKGKKWHDPKLDRVALSFEKVKEILEKENRIIKNATIGGKLEIFERVDFNSLF